MRDCLNEEITQALGPANDLYRLPDSIWNDDNFHGLATPFDMLILRVLYQPELASGMTQDRGGGGAAALLARENPAGRGAARAGPASRNRAAWADAIEEALARDAPRPDAARGGAASRPRSPPRCSPVDHRLGVSLLTLGRLNLRNDPAAGGAALRRRLRALPRGSSGPSDLRTAQAGVHLAALALGTGQYAVAVALAERHLPAARSGQNAILIAGLLAVEAEALAELGDAEAAQAARLDSLRWARYGFGDSTGRSRASRPQLAALIQPRERVRPMLLLARLRARPRLSAGAAPPAAAATGSTGCSTPPRTASPSRSRRWRSRSSPSAPG